MHRSTHTTLTFLRFTSCDEAKDTVAQVESTRPGGDHKQRLGRGSIATHDGKAPDIAAPAIVTA